MMESQPILFRLMLKQGFHRFTLALKDVEIEMSKRKVFILQKWQEKSALLGILSSNQSGLVYQDVADVDLTIWTVKGY